MPKIPASWLIASAFLVGLWSGAPVSTQEVEESEKPLSAAEVVGLLGPSVVLIQVGLGDGQAALGSGFFVDPKGVIATSLHLLDGAKSVRVRVEGERFESHSVLAFDIERDLALIEIEAEGFKAAVPGDTSTLSRGDVIYVISNPLGLAGTVSEGIVGAWREPSAEGEDDLGVSARIGSLAQGRLLQMSAAVSPGSSGAPVFDEYGYVVGIVAGGMGEGALNLNFAIPIDALMPLLAEGGRGWDLAGLQITLDSRRRDLAEPYLVDARFYIANEDFKEAARSLERALGLFPRSGEALTLKGEVLLAAGQVEEAGELFGKAVELNPESAEAWENFGGFLLTHKPQERLTEAAAAFEKTLDLEPWRAEAAMGLGIALAAEGRVQEARAMLEQAVESDREHLRAWVTLGKICVLQRDLKAAEEAFEAAVWIDGENASATCGLAKVYYFTSDQRVGEYQQRCEELSKGQP